MGAMKRLYTMERNGGMATQSPENRRAWRALKSGSQILLDGQRMLAEHAAKQLLPTGALQSICAELDYVGKQPTVDGQYVVIDVLTGSMKLALVGVMIGTCRSVAFLGMSGTTPVEAAATPFQRWFLIHKPSTEDLAFVRGLPTSQPSEVADGGGEE